jgi:tRNA-binding EMAP/Myf-like protein
MITFEDFKKIEMRAGKILSAEKIPDTDKLLKLSVDFGETKEIIENISETEVKKSLVSSPRQIVSGISFYFPDPQTLVGKTCMFCTNLEPRKIKGYESNGMIIAVSDEQGNFSLLEPNSSIKPGTLAK